MHWQAVPPQAGEPRHDPADPQHAHRAALWQQDDLVQQLAVAKYALTVGDAERAMAALDAALSTARLTLSDLLVVTATADAAPYGDHLLRSAPAMVPLPAADPAPEARPAT